MLNIDTSGFFASAAVTAGYDKLSKSCQEKIFPLSSGGSKNEFVSCTVYDDKNQQILVGGNSTSEDYAPAANEHAFVYAVDMEGNWKWGKFYYNVSYAVSTISGCSMDGNGNLVAFAIGDSKPILLEIDVLDGTVSKFISFDRKSGSDKSMPLFHSFNAIYHDTNDVDDGLSYYYISFFQDHSLQIVRLKRDTKEVVWNYQYKYVTEDDSLKYLMTFTPALLHQDPADRSRMYLLGRFADRASVIKFSKNSMNIDWKL